MADSVEVNGSTEGTQRACEQAYEDEVTIHNDHLTGRGRSSAAAPGGLCPSRAAFADYRHPTDKYVAHHNTDPKPFLWTKRARDILQKVIRANGRLGSKQNETLH